MKRSDKWPRFPTLRLPRGYRAILHWIDYRRGDRPAAATNIGAWYKEVKKFQDAALSTRLGIPMLFAIDAIHGNANLHGATVFPHEIGLGATRDAELVQQIGQATAEEILAAGYTMDLSPILAVPQDIRWGRTDESYSENTDLVSELGAAFIKGLQSPPVSQTGESGRTIYVVATSKHFLGDGGTTAGTSTWTNNGKTRPAGSGRLPVQRGRYQEFVPAPLPGSSGCRV